MTKDKGNDPGSAPNEPPGEATGAAPAPTEPTTSEAADSSGLESALATLTEAYGDEVVTLWRVSGQRKSRTDEIACVLAEVGGYPRRLIVQSFTSGNFKLFVEIGGKTAEQQIESLRDMYEPAFEEVTGQ